MEELAFLRTCLIALLLAASTTSARELVPATTTFVVNESLAPKGYALRRAGMRVVLQPRPDRFARAESLRAVASPFGVLVTLPLRGWQLKALQGWADGACEVIALAPHGLTSSDAAMLSLIGPCSVRVHAPQLPPTLPSARPLSFVLEAGAVLPDQEVLERLAKAPLPVLSVNEDLAQPALAALADSSVTLAIRARAGRLTPAVFEALHLPGRKTPLRIVVDGALDPIEARRIRRLTKTSVEIDLTRVTRWPSDLDEALAALARPVDAPEQRRIDEHEADAPLFRSLPRLEGDSFPH